MPLGKQAREQLERQLLLSQGGGIYYENARVDASDTEATLFIGLGGTGADMLIRVKNEVKRRMVLPQVNGKVVSDTPNNIGFLAIDADKSSATKKWGTATFDEFGTEFCSIEVADKQAIVTKWKSLAESNAEEAKWYDKIDAVGALPGAGGIRQLGRLMLFENIRNTRDRIKQKLSELIAGKFNKVNVIVVAGIAGGTGSGTFIDIAYITRSAMEELSIPGRNVFGYIIMPDVNLLNGGTEALKRNGFAALKELDYWMSPGKIEQDAQFIQDYGSMSIRLIASPVFDFCHLLSAQDMNGFPLTYDKVIGSMAENVFAYIAGETNATSDSSGNSTMASLYDNINGYIIGLSADAPIPACYRYLAVGSQKLEIPYEEISTLLAARLFERLKPTFDLRPTEETFKADMTHMQLVPKHVIDGSLDRDVPASPLDGNPNYQYSQIWGGENNGAQSNRAYSDVYSWLAHEYENSVKVHAKNWASNQNGIFRNFITNNMVKADRGPQYLTALIKSDSEWSMIKTLRGMAEKCDGAAATCRALQGEIENKLQSTYNAGYGKMLNKNRHVTDYIVALRDWMNNEMCLYVYPHRAEAIREFQGMLEIYYEKIFYKLSSVLDELPEIFSQNLKKIEIEQRKAEQEGKLDETKLIWPLKFEKEKQNEFNKMLEGGITGFLDEMTANLNKWTGCDMDALDATTTNTDVPGFISKFVSDYFGSLLRINMEDIMRGKEGADNLDNYLRRTLINLKDESVPMFSMRHQYRNRSTAEFSLASVPQDCLDILASANSYVNSLTDSDRIKVKTSKEKTRLYFVKVVAGVPLYAYSQIEDIEEVYERAKTNPTGEGMHLDGKWKDSFPTPLPEAAWTPTKYENLSVKKYNESVRAAFDFCMQNNIIRPDNVENPKKYLLYIADSVKANANTLDLDGLGSIEDQIEALKEARDELWGDKSVDLTPIGKFGNSLVERVRESVLRIPRIAAEIKRQADIVRSFSERQKEIEDPQYFAFALICALVTKQNFRIVLKSSIDSAISDMLYDATLEKSFGEYEAYKVFCQKLDDQRRDDINLIRRDLLDRVALDRYEKERLVDRVSEIVETYKKALSDIMARISHATKDKRKALADIYAFYAAVLKVAESYKDSYLA